MQTKSLEQWVRGRHLRSTHMSAVEGDAPPDAVQDTAAACTFNLTHYVEQHASATPTNVMFVCNKFFSFFETV